MFLWETTTHFGNVWGPCQRTKFGSGASGQPVTDFGVVTTKEEGTVPSRTQETPGNTSTSTGTSSSGSGEWKGPVSPPGILV